MWAFHLNFRIRSEDESTHCQWRIRELPGTGGSEGPWSPQSVLQQTEKAERECDHTQAMDPTSSSQKQPYRSWTTLPRLRAWSGRWPPCWAGVHAAWWYLLQLDSKKKYAYISLTQQTSHLFLDHLRLHSKNAYYYCAVITGISAFWTLKGKILLNSF